jgi:tRNA nucleotidyltransferase (CCA-adding enzyme)
MTAIVEHLERNGFAVHHAHYTMEEERCMFLMELLVTELPCVRIHKGPPLWNRVNAEKFRQKHVISPLPGPYINDGKYEMEVPREFTRAEELLTSETLLQVRLGKHVRQVLANGWELQIGPECWHEEFAPFIAGFFDRCSPLVRVKRE